MCRFASTSNLVAIEIGIRSRLPDLRATGNGGWRRSASNVELSALMPVPSKVYSHDAEHADEPHVPRRPPITAQMEAGCTLSTGPPRLVSTLHRAPCDRIKSQSVRPLVLQYHLLLLLSVPLFYFHTFQVVDRLCYPFFRPTLLSFDTTRCSTSSSSFSPPSPSAEVSFSESLTAEEASC